MTNHYQTHNVSLAHLLPNMDLAAAGEVSVRNLCLDTRHLKVGDAFIAVAGSKYDGKDFIVKAIELGAATVLVDADKKWQGVSWLGAVPVVAIDNLNAHISEIAGRYYGDPSAQCSIIGVTGTNGKTSCTLYIAQLLAELKSRSAAIGTLGYGALDVTAQESMATQIRSFVSTGLTTPDPIALQRIIYELVQASATTIAMEASSHSLQQGRTSGIAIKTAVFTNLTQDHLDYHQDMQSYGNAKALLLQARSLETAVINLDDTWARSLLTKMPAGIKTITYSTQAQPIENQSVKNIVPDVHAKNIRYLDTGVIADVITPWGEGEIKSPLFGLFNLSNLLAVIAVVCSKGFSLTQLIPLIEKLQPAPGRMQSVVVDTLHQDIQVIVDYAHTPDALEKTLAAIRQHTSKRIWTVFGCGGDRDKLKRPLMGRIAERLSDCVIVTNDNPRSEEPASIAADIVRDMDRPNGCLVIADRAQAIDLAVQQAASGDTVLIAGKGHEEYQIFATQTLPFSDLKQANFSLEKRIIKRANGHALQGARS